MAGIILPYSTIGVWGAGWHLDYDYIHDMASANWASGGGTTADNVKGTVTNTYLIKRGMFDIDCSDLPPSLTINCAKLVAPIAVWESTFKEVNAVLVDATGVTVGDSGYGEILSKEASLGSILVPITGGTFYTGKKEIILNAAGIAFLEASAGGIARFGLRIDEEINAVPPIHAEKQRFGIGPLPEPFYIHANYLPTAGGYIWVEGTKLAYIDNSLDKRTQEGTKAGATGQTPGHLWVEGTNLRYIDASGDERYITGTQEGATGKTTGHIWIEETKLRYIDSSGNERCFEGTA